MQDLTAGDDTESKPEAAAYKVYVTADKAFGRHATHSPDDDRRPVDAATEIYKIYVATAESNIERRLKLNQYYYSVVAAIVVAYAYLIEGRLKPPSETSHLLDNTLSNSPITSNPMLMLLPASLLIICLAWWFQLRSAEAVSRQKFCAIKDIEDNLAVKPFRTEDKYRVNGWLSGSKIERIVPILFGILSVLAILIYVVLPSLK